MIPGRRTGRPADRRALLVFSLALLLRLLYLLDGRDTPTFFTPISDAMTYDLAARALAHGGGGAGQLFWQSPFYPLFLAGVYRLFGASMVAAKLVQALLGAFTCLLTYLLGRKIFTPNIGLAAGLIAAACGPLFFMDGELLAGGWAAFFAIGLVLLFLRAAARPHLGTEFLLGVTSGLAVLTRPEFLLALVAAYVWLFRQRREFGTRPRAHGRLLGAAFLGLAVTLVPVGVGSLRATGRFAILPASGGINLYLGNNPRAEETINARPGTEWSDLMDLPAERGVFTPDLWARQAVYRGEVLRYARTEPRRYLAGLGRKTAQLFCSREIPRNDDLYLLRRWSILLRLLVWKLGPFGFPMGILLPLALIGGARRAPSVPGIFWIFLGLYSLSIVLVFVTGRYRAALLPLVSVLAASGGASILQWTRARDIRRLGSGAAAMGGLVLLATLPGPFTAERMNYEPEMYDGIGRTLGRRGQFQAAVTQIERAVALNPEYADGHANLAYMLERAGRTDDAIAEYRRALELNPRMVHADEGLGRLLGLQGRSEEAIATYRRGLELRPHQISLRTSLADLLVSLGRSDEAQRELEAALRYDPEHPLALYLLGTELARRGDYEPAEEMLRRSLRSAPRRPNLVSLGDVCFALAKVRRLRQDPDGAIELYSQAIREYKRELAHDPHNPNIRKSMGAVIEDRKTHLGR